MKFYCHANLIEKNKSGVLIIGKEGSGKSTISYFYVKKLGYSLVADDLVQIFIRKNSVVGSLANKKFKGSIHLPIYSDKILKITSIYDCIIINRLVVLNNIPALMKDKYQLLIERIKLVYFYKDYK